MRDKVDAVAFNDGVEDIIRSGRRIDTRASAEKLHIAVYIEHTCRIPGIQTYHLRTSV